MLGNATAASAAALCFVSALPAQAAPTPAGTSISNTATLQYGDAGAVRSVTSNTVTLSTAEIVDVTVIADHDAVTLTSGDVLGVGYVVTNTGNGGEDFVLAASADPAGAGTLRLAIDGDDDGRYDPAHDPDVSADAPLVTLAAGQSRRVFVLVTGAAVTRPTQVALAATARIGSGTPGTLIAGAGAGGVDVEIGRTGATARAQTLLTPPSAAQPTLIKSQTVLAPDGSTRAVRGSIITYSLVAALPAATHGVALDDPIPAGTAYVPGSLTLDARALTDAADDDAGQADASHIHVALGDVSVAATRTVQFSVKIQ